MAGDDLQDASVVLFDVSAVRALSHWGAGPTRRFWHRARDDRPTIKLISVGKVPEKKFTLKSISRRVPMARKGPIVPDMELSPTEKYRNLLSRDTKVGREPTSLLLQSPSSSRFVSKLIASGKFPES